MPDEEEDQEESQAEQEEDQSMIEAGTVDLPEVFNKMMSPVAESKDKDITRDIKLTKVDDAQIEFLTKLKAMINLCRSFGIAEKFYKSLHDYYTNIRAAYNGFTAENIVSNRQFLRKEYVGEKKKGWFR